jgi:TATA-box binding protein (TBP) (component of TFIID and TFIIIB)
MMSATSGHMATPFKISTITATGSLTDEKLNIDIDTLFDAVSIDPLCAEGVLYAEFGKKKKGVSKKMAKRIVVVKNYKKFDNQLTLEYKIKMDEFHFTILNCKIFNNGNVQMTGVKYIEQGEVFLERIRDIIMGSPEMVCDKTRIKACNYQVRMINCDYKFGFSIKRDCLFNILINKYQNVCSFEPCIYPGVKIQYMWKHGNVNGICKCPELCAINKRNSICKKITIAVFQSGCVIITGAQSIDQINEAYDWINAIILSNKENIEKKIVPIPVPSQGDKRKMLIPKSRILSFRS